MNKIKSFGKFVLSGILAFVFLTMFCYFYYNIPAHYESLDSATDYKWQPNSFYSRGTEGFAFGKINNDGYNNVFDYNDSTNLDVLIMGSSHMEAFQVDAKQTTAYVLDTLLEEENVYNIGVSDHSFLVCANNLKAAIDKYRPNKYVIIETRNLEFEEKSLLNILNGNFEKIPSKTGGILGLLQKNQFLRLVYKQLKGFLNKEVTTEDVKNSENDSNIKLNETLLEELLLKLKETVSAEGIELIILYHPSTTLDKNGQLVLASETEDVDTFSKLCKKNDIYFLNMSNRFLEEYNTKHILPYGFSNTSVGSGHLNKYGHEMIAEELYNLIMEVE